MKTWVKKVHLVKQQNITSKTSLIKKTFDTRTKLSARKRLNYVEIFCQELTLFIANDQNGYRRLGKPLITKNVVHDSEIPMESQQFLYPLSTGFFPAWF